jgi:hypothetical protein
MRFSQPEPRHAIEHPGELGVLGHLALVEDDRALRVEAAGKIRGGDLANVAGQFLRILECRDGMHIHHAIDALMRFLHGNPVHHGAKVITEVKRVRRLHAGKDAFGEGGHQGSRRVEARLSRKPRPRAKAPPLRPRSGSARPPWFLLVVW